MSRNPEFHPGDLPSDEQPDEPLTHPWRSHRPTGPVAPGSTLVGPLTLNTFTAEAAALITARAYGHCEILAPACLYQQHALISRRSTSLARDQHASPIAGIAACTNCIELIEHTERQTAIHLGYIAAAHMDLATHPVYWRQQRWVSLDHFGYLTDRQHGRHQVGWARTA